MDFTAKARASRSQGKPESWTGMVAKNKRLHYITARVDLGSRTSAILGCVGWNKG